MVVIWMAIFQLYYVLKSILQNEIVIQIQNCNSQDELNIASIENFDEPPPEYTPEYPPAYHPECPPPYTLSANTWDEPDETLLQWNNPMGSNQTQLLSTTYYGYI